MAIVSGIFRIDPPLLIFVLFVISFQARYYGDRKSLNRKSLNRKSLNRKSLNRKSLNRRSHRCF